MSDLSINQLATLFAEHEQEEAGGETSIFGEECWVYVFTRLTLSELTTLAAHGPQFLVEDHSNDPVWEKAQNLVGEWDNLPIQEVGQ